MVLKINYSTDTIEQADPRFCFVYFMAHAIGSKKFDVVYFGYQKVKVRRNLNFFSFSILTDESLMVIFDYRNKQQRKTT